MKNYLLVIITYLLSLELGSLLFRNIHYAYATKVILTLPFLIYFWKTFPELKKPKIDITSILTGILIIVIWIGLDPFYPHLAYSSGYNPNISPNPILFTSIKLFGFLLLAPIIEELFIRSWMNRYIQNKNWKKIPIYKFTTASFIITTLIFGFLHNRWLVALITSVLLNILLIKKKTLWSPIVAHFVANLILAIYILTTNSWAFW